MSAAAGQRGNRRLGQGAGRGCDAGLLKGCSGQMAVEMAVVMPAVIVVALVGYNLARFVTLCAAFDRVSLDAIVAQGVAPAGNQTQLTAVDEVRRCIEEAMGSRDVCGVEVTAERVGVDSGGHMLSVSPLLTRFTCTLVFRPWPSSFSLGSMAFEAPFALRHERSLVVDRYRAGVVW